MRWTRRRSIRSRNEGPADALEWLAEQCAAALWSQLPADAALMNSAELRGYVRARALAAIRQLLATCVAANGESCRLSSAELADIVERSVHLVMRRQLLDLHAPRARRMAA